MNLETEITMNVETENTQNSESKRKTLIKLGDRVIYEGENMLVNAGLTLVGVGAGVGAVVGAVVVPVYSGYYMGRIVKYYAEPVLKNLWGKFISR